MFILQLDLGVGDVVCFSSPLLSSQGLRGKWSSDAKLLEVDEESGVALISHEGSGQLKYRTADGQTTVRDVSVSPAPVFRFHDAYSDIITNSDDFIYRFPVALRGKNVPSLAKSSCSAEKVGLFFAKRPSKLSCHLSFAANNNEIPIGDVFSVESGFDVRSGFHQCVIKPVSTSAALSRHSSTQLTLKARYGSLSADFALQWEPAFVVTTPVVNFNDVEDTAFLEISAQSSVVKVTRCEVSILNVYSRIRFCVAEFGIPFKRYYCSKAWGQAREHCWRSQDSCAFKFLLLGESSVASYN